MTDSKNLVLIDTCVWATYFQRRQSQEKQVIDRLLDEDRIAVIGPVLTEVLRGFRRDAEADWAASSLRALQYINVGWDQ